jgi:hypothetical protein
MRPTELQLRKPRDRTPDFYDTKVTYNGQSLGIVNKGASSMGSLPKEKRFFFYDKQKQKTLPRVGPGAYDYYDYNTMASNCLKRCIVQYKQPNIDTYNNECYMVGNHLIVDNSTRKLRSQNRSASQSTLRTSRSKTPTKTPTKTSRPESRSRKNLRPVAYLRV